MKLHGNARTCPNSRRLLVQRVTEEGWSASDAAAAAGISQRTVYRWLGRFRQEGAHGLIDRSSRPRRSPRQLPPAKVQAIRSLRRLRMTAAEIAEVLSLALSTVSLWLMRIGLGKRSRLQPPEPPNRYERRHAGELVHVISRRWVESLRVEPATEWWATVAANACPDCKPKGGAWRPRPALSTCT